MMKSNPAASPVSIREQRATSEALWQPMAYWAATIILALIMFSGAYGELTQQFGTIETHTVLGYPTYLLNIIGIWKILGALAILVPGLPRLKEWAYAGMFFNMTGAFISHAIVGDPTYHLLATGSIAALVVVSWALRPSNRVLRKLSPQLG
jgi:uncharacterized membrane protein YphA (DoxX/SURF4 family)